MTETPDPPLAVIFDMDGVLIDSVALNWRAYNQVLADYKVHVPDSELHRYVKSVVIEDAPVGVEAAKNARMKSCAVLTPFVLKEQLAGADLVVSSLEDVTVNDLEALIA